MLIEKKVEQGASKKPKAYRNQLDIIADILSSVRSNPKKTHLMYSANLSYRLLEKYTSALLRSDLISFDDENRKYSLTQKGLQFVEIYAQYELSKKHPKTHPISIRNLKSRLSLLCTENEKDF